MHLTSRHPVAVHPWSNVVKPFNSIVWVALGITLLCVIFTLFIIYNVYKIMLLGNTLIKVHNATLADFIMNLFGSLTEPNVYPWFTHMANAGRFLIGFWSLGILILGLAYNSLMRSFLIQPSFESPINTPEDVLNRGANIYVIGTVPDPSKPDELNDFFHLLDQRLVNYAKERNTIRGFPPTFFLTDEIVEDILENGATAFTLKVN